MQQPQQVFPVDDQQGGERPEVQHDHHQEQPVVILGIDRPGPQPLPQQLAEHGEVSIRADGQKLGYALQDAQQDRFHVVGHVQLPPGRGESPQNKRASRPNGHTRATDSSRNDRWSGSCPSCGLDLAGRARECQRESHSGFRLSLARSFAADPGRAAFRPGVASVAQFAQSAFSRWIQFRG